LQTSHHLSSSSCRAVRPTLASSADIPTGDNPIVTGPSAPRSCSASHVSVFPAMCGAASSRQTCSQQRPVSSRRENVPTVGSVHASSPGISPWDHSMFWILMAPRNQKTSQFAAAARLRGAALSRPACNIHFDRSLRRAGSCAVVSGAAVRHAFAPKARREAQEKRPRAPFRGPKVSAFRHAQADTS
jgi:hypothetical protein